MRIDERTVQATLRAWDEGLESWDGHDEVVFWLEHDLFDQLILIRHLHWLAGVQSAGARQRLATRFSLICIDRFPAVVRFTGLGALSSSQLATLFPQRQPITPAQIAAGRDAWNMFRAADPRPLLAATQSGFEPLPLLAGALSRHFEDYPSTRDGLSRTERQILTDLAAGHDTFAALFHAAQDAEERVYMGDAIFLAILNDLASARHPLVHLEGPASLPPTDSRFSLTPAGRDVLAGRADHVALNGIDRWMGGVRVGEGACWRWDGHSLAIAD